MESVVVKRFENPWIAHIARGRLAAEGIAASVTNEHHCAADWRLAYALGLVELRVPESEASRAWRILSENDAGNYAQLSPTDRDSDTPTCSNCGSAAIVRVRNLRTKAFWAYAMSCFLFGVFWPLSCWIERCRHCGETDTV